MTATTAMVVHHWAARHELLIVPMTTPTKARVELGPALADAKAFVLETCCTECGVEACSTTPCTSCATPTCGCLPDPHGTEHWFCADCQPPACFGPCCHDDR